VACRILPSISFKKFSNLVDFTEHDNYSRLNSKLYKTHTPIRTGYQKSQYILLFNKKLKRNKRLLVPIDN